MSNETESGAKPVNRRNRVLTVLAGVVVLAAIGYGIWWILVASHYESTDDAYVSGNVVMITPQVAGTVVAIKADDTDIVKAGQDLVLLDPADAQVALDQAEAQLAQAVREAHTLFVNNSTLEANIAARDADIVKAQAGVNLATDDLNRRQALVATGAVSKEEMHHIETQVADANSVLAAAVASAHAAREQLESNQTLTDGTSVEEHPNVKRAAARVREAYLALVRARLPAPVSGQVAKRSVQVGQRVQPGTPLMAIVPLDNLWVDANFKEVQLRNMRVGQPVTLVADVYGGKIEYHGKVTGMGAGTGSAFSLLPAQNATGNWIKVVQRIPVRVVLDASEVQAHPLRIGLSMEVTVDVSDTRGTQLAATQRVDTGYATQAFAQQPNDADNIVRAIIAANAGPAPAPKSGIPLVPANAAKSGHHVQS